jgi:predicted dehydrogenase
MSKELTRRTVLTQGAAGLMAAGLPAWFADEAEALEREQNAGAQQKFDANSQINIGLIGPGGSRGGFRQGLGDTIQASRKAGVKVVAVCDVDALHMTEAANVFKLEMKDAYKDYRDLLARKDIDAVVIGTPDHWHSIIATAAMKAGKDVYCEKPLTLTIDEGKRLVKTQKATGRVFQTGSQQRSDSRFRLACELVRNGRIGKLKNVTCHLPGGNIGGPFEVKPVPADFDFDFWLGPAPVKDYVVERTHGSFRHWLDYSGGMLTDWGAHHHDIAQWGLGMDSSGPISVQGYGRSAKIGENCYNAFPEYDIYFTYPNGVTMHTTNQGENGVEFEGENGTLFVSRGTIRASDPAILEEALPSNATRLYVSNDHVQNFIDCIRTRQKPICNVEVGHRSVSVCHLANISLRCGGRKLEWDPVAERFPKDKEAESMVARAPRKTSYY